MEIEGAAYLFGFAATAAAYHVDAEKESVEFLYLKGADKGWNTNKVLGVILPARGGFVRNFWAERRL